MSKSLDRSPRDSSRKKLRDKIEIQKRKMGD